MFIKTFGQISKKDVSIAGGKGTSLGEMSKAGLPVPPGFVVLAGAFDRFLQETDLNSEIETILKKVNHKDINSVDKASAEIRRMILDAEMPEDLQKEILGGYYKLSSSTTSPPSELGYSSLKRRRENSPQPPLLKRGGGLVAVRSSATAEDSKVASWAGELETYLNVTEKDVVKSVKKCWSSLFTPRAIFYAFEKGFYKSIGRSTNPLTLHLRQGHGGQATLSRKGRGGKRISVSVAVVVQKMVQSEVSGITFTVHPVTKDYNQMVIEAALGLGEAIVGGMVTPDTYVIHKKDFSILDINISEQNMMIVKTPKGNVQKKLAAKAGGKQKLTGKQIIELAKICKKIEQHYKHPQDIEWALEKNKFYITQSRPITTL